MPISYIQENLYKVYNYTLISSKLDFTALYYKFLTAEQMFLLLEAIAM